MSVIRLRLVDRSDRKPDDKDQDDNTVQDRANFVNPSNEPCALHSNEALNDQDEQKRQIQMPCLEDIVWICNLTFTDRLSYYISSI
jgi:hypothetical protein